MDEGTLVTACLVDATAKAFVNRMNEVISNASAGLPNDVSWLSNFVAERADAGDYQQLTRNLLIAVFTLTATAWAEQIGSHTVRAGYTGIVDLDTAISARQAKASAFLRTFREKIRNQTIEKLLPMYTATIANGHWSLQQRVSFSLLVVEPVVLQRIYVAHCNVLNIPATFDVILTGRSEEELVQRFRQWKESRATCIIVLNAMLKAYFMAGYCVFRRLEAVCKTGRSYMLVKDVHTAAKDILLGEQAFYPAQQNVTGKCNIREINPPSVSCFRSVDSRAIDSL
jgi:hypothetical protein